MSNGCFNGLEALVSTGEQRGQKRNDLTEENSCSLLIHIKEPISTLADFLKNICLLVVSDSLLFQEHPGLKTNDIVK
ncbi:hypothetical protein ACTXT7_000719 [Hymenolepis weldensis]